MTVYPGATYRPLNEFSDAGRRPRLGVVLHVNDGDASSLYDWIAGTQTSVENGPTIGRPGLKTGTLRTEKESKNPSCPRVGGFWFVAAIPCRDPLPKALPA